MFLNKEKLAIVYLSPNSLVYYRENTKQSLSLSFPKQVVADLEVKDKKQFTALLESFVSHNKITPVDTVILISTELCFSRNFNVDDPKLSNAIQSFLESTPFENVGEVSMNKAKTTTVITTNKDLYTLIEDIFSKYGFLVTQIIPWPVLTAFGLENKTSFDQEVARFIFSNYIQLKSFNFPYESKEITSLPTVENEPVKKKSNKRVFLLGGVFIFLLLILVIMIIFRPRG